MGSRSLLVLYVKTRVIFGCVIFLKINALSQFHVAYNSVIEVALTANGDYQVKVSSIYHVYDVYDWNVGDEFNFGPITIKSSFMNSLHEAGIAQEYISYGASSVQTQTFTISGE
jgi:hypothetical protein